MAKKNHRTRANQDLHRTVFEGDNLDVLRGINSESIDLIYLDPPFNSNKVYEAPVGSKAAGAAFKDAWTLSDVDLIEHNRLKREQEWLYALIHAAKKTHSRAMFSYLMMMSPRLFELKRVLKTTGSIYLHCDPTASHYLKLVMDGIFGSENFRNEVIWERTPAKALMTRRLPSNHDVLISYQATRRATWNAEAVFAPYDPANLDEKTSLKYRHRDPGGRLYRLDNLLNPNRDRPNLTYEFLGVTRVWRWTQERMQTAYDEGLIVQTKPGGVPQMKRYLDQQKGRPLGDVWTDILPLNSQAKERIGYPTQKPLALLDRILRASSNEGDMVLDPFCGCATTLVSAEFLNRQWCGIDLSPKAAELVVRRIREKQDMFAFKGFRHATNVPIRTDVEREKASTPKERRDLKNKLYNDQEGRCNLCHEEFSGPRHFDMDHIVPKAMGGQDWVDNFQLLCGSCNNIKGTGTQESARARIAKYKGMDLSVFE